MILYSVSPLYNDDDDLCVPFCAVGSKINYLGNMSPPINRITFSQKC